MSCVATYSRVITPIRGSLLQARCCQVRQLATFVRSLDTLRKAAYDAAVAVERERLKMEREAASEAERRQRNAELDEMLQKELARQEW